MSSASLPGTATRASAKTPPRPSVHLQAALRRHVLTRCEHPRHARRTNTPGEGLVPCYRACHQHPRRLRCTGLSREEYFEHIIGMMGMMGTIGGA